MPSDDIFEKLTQFAQQAVVHLRVKSALNPLLWLCGIVTPLSFVLMCFLSGGLQIALVCIGAFPVGFTCLAFMYFMLTDS